MLLSQKKRGRGVLPELIQVVLSIPPRHFARTTPCAPFFKGDSGFGSLPPLSGLIPCDCLPQKGPLTSEPKPEPSGVGHVVALPAQHGVAQEPVAVRTPAVAAAKLGGDPTVRAFVHRDIVERIGPGVRLRNGPFSLSTLIDQKPSTDRHPRRPRGLVYLLAPFLLSASKTEVNSSLIPKIVLVKVVETSQRRAPNPCKKVVQLYGPQPYGLVQFDVQRAAKPHREAHP